MEAGSEVNRRVISPDELVRMPSEEFVMLVKCFEAKAFRLCGFNYKKYIRWARDYNGNIIIEWE